ncbi:MAG: AraC family transcriptional regulator [Edaphobacter sp.]|uniref:AraC family transcriptional regulator n=1 Tax=Edaphobacter sp. TaxID=1934404 RepID=UPI00238A397B|nr:AraC family transcriptional regulator [Edaphobacter sp.]MDE1176670.1 AraC family transcriptional regulator [Edaphobacter sp.]
MDPLSEVLSLLKLRGFMAGGFDLAGAWSLEFGPHEGIKCYAMVTGWCWLAVEGVEPVRLEAGDCFLLPRGLPFRMATDLSLPPTDARAVFHMPMRGRIATWNGGGECFGLGGFFALEGQYARLLLSELPPVVHIKGESERTELRWLLERMRVEVLEPRPGGSLVAQQLATMMLVQALRLHLKDGLSGRAGWLSALTNRQMQAAITSIHDAPAKGWTLAQLAQRCGMSRSIFAAKFKTTVGVSPMEYLTRWRMLLAGDRLRQSDDAVASIAQSLGYASESAFSKAFRRVMGSSPRQFRGAEAEAVP